MINYNAIGVLMLMAIVASFFLSCGVWILRTPVEKLLEWDRRTGYWLYPDKPMRPDDEKQSLAFASGFYKVIGYLFAGFSAIYLLIVIAALIATLTGAITIRNV